MIKKIPYKDWDSVLKFLRGIEYEDARHEKVCIAADHVLLSKHKEQCCHCGRTWKSTHDYYILGLRRSESIFFSKESVINRMQHWENKDNWLQVNQMSDQRERYEMVKDSRNSLILGSGQ